MIVVSIGCPAGIGPEVSVRAAARLSRIPRVLVGDRGTILAAARLCGVAESRFADFGPASRGAGKIWIQHVGPELSERDRQRPTRQGGRAQLAWIDAAYDLVRAAPRRALCTGPVSKVAIARSAVRGAASFRGHTEWLEKRDGASYSVMCFVAPTFATSLVTTHLPLSKVPRRVDASKVRVATVELAHMLQRLGTPRPRIAVASLNPHAGEGELLGTEEQKAIVPGMRAARRSLRSVELVGPIGAETAFRRAHAGHVHGVVAMYHDQATIPTKLVAFGSAVNVTLGLSVVRTSVDHGTGYDIAWQGRADENGMIAAMRLAERLSRA